MPSARLRIGKIWVDEVDFAQALDAIEALALSGQGGAVYTPNVDHVVKADRIPAFAQAYERARISVPDGMPLVWASKLLGLPLRERVAGSDLVEPLMRRAARHGLRVYLLGGAPGSAEIAAERLRDQGVHIVGVDAPMLGLSPTEGEAQAIRKVRESAAQVLLVGLGAPKQELFIARALPELPGVVALGIGATLDFLAGRVKRAPRWIARSGLEWLFRLMLEPRRLARRYLVDDPAFAGILLRTLREPRGSRLSLPTGKSPARASPH